MVLVNITKRMENHPFFGACFSINIWIFLTSPLHPDLFQKCCVLIFLCVHYCMSTVQRSFVSFFGLVSTLKYYLSLCRSLLFKIHLGIHPTKMGDKLVYYYLHHEEASFNWTYILNCLIVLFSFLIQTQHLSILV